jgi:hypothetical protein
MADKKTGVLEGKTMTNIRKKNTGICRCDTGRVVLGGFCSGDEVRIMRFPPLKTRRERLRIPAEIRITVRA